MSEIADDARAPSTGSAAAQDRPPLRLETLEAVRLAVLRRDMWRCFVPGCARFGNVCDHVRPVTPLTTDAKFYDPAGLRASCHFHNTRRGHVEAFQRELDQAEPVPTVPSPYYGRGRPRTSAVVTRDYSRKSTT